MNVAKYVMTCAIGAIAISVSTNSAATAQIGIGKPPPDFHVADVAGKPQSLKQYRGKIVVLDWANPECRFDSKHYRSGNLPNLQKQARADGIVWLTVNSAGKDQEGDFSGARLNQWLKSVSWSGASYIRDSSGAIGKSFRATATPQIYVIGKDGKLLYTGALDSIPSNDIADIPKAKNYLKVALAEIKAGKRVSVPATRPYGCSVKYGPSVSAQ